MSRPASQPITTRQHSACPVCSGTDFTDRWKVGGYSIVRCKDCSLVFVKENPTPQELQAYYDRPHDSVYHDSNVDCLNFYYNTLAGQIAKRHPVPGRVLDVGCSGGWFLDVMHGWDRYGSEINPADAAIARQRYGDHIFEGPFQDYPEDQELFDVITLQDVFDHFAEPVPILRKCHKLLKPGGSIVIKVHNISCLYAKAFGARFYAVIPPSHLCYYDRHTLYRVLRDTGFDPAETKYVTHQLQLKTVFFRLSRGSTTSPFHKIYRSLSGSRLGRLRIHKNLHDIITVFAVRNAAPLEATTP